MFIINKKCKTILLYLNFILFILANDKYPCSLFLSFHGLIYI